MDKEQEQQRFLELSALFSKNNAIKHIILLEQKIAEYENNQTEAPIGPTESSIERFIKCMNEQKDIDPDILAALNEFEKIAGKTIPSKPRL